MTIDSFALAPSIKISDEALSLAGTQVLESLPLETGGIMVGWWEENGIALVQALLSVCDPGAGGSRYKRIHSRAQEVLEHHLLVHGDDRCGYIGEWHSHPAPQPPSSTDRKSLSSIVREARSPIALIVLSVSSEGGIVPHGLIGRPHWLRRATVEAVAVRKATE